MVRRKVSCGVTPGQDLQLELLIRFLPHIRATSSSRDLFIIPLLTLDYPTRFSSAFPFMRYSNHYTVRGRSIRNEAEVAGGQSAALVISASGRHTTLTHACRRRYPRPISLTSPRFR